MKTVLFFPNRMVRTYKRKKLQDEVSEENMKKAVADVLQGRTSIRAAASAYNIRKSTLYDRVKKKKKLTLLRGNDSGNESEEDNRNKFATRQVFSTNEEKELENYLKRSSKIFYGLTYEGTRKLAFQYAVRLGKNYPLSWNKNEMAGKDWMHSFMRRHCTLSHRKPENTSMARASAFNQANVDLFFNNYSEVQSRYHFQPNNIYNIDETGIQTVVQAPKVIAEKGSKGVGQSVSAERGSLVTMCGIISASGNTIPPVYIFPRIRMKEQFMYGAVTGAIGFAGQSGWMTANIFVKVLQHIQKYTSCNTENKILIIMDNHETHISLEAILYSRANGIVLLSFPPHCTHQMQPLDKAILDHLNQELKSRLMITF